MRPRWLEELEGAVRAGFRGIILAFNTTDYVMDPRDEELARPRPLPYFLAAYLSRRGYRVAYYSLAAGLADMGPAGRDRLAPLQRLAGERSPRQVLPALTPLLRGRECRLSLILDYADHLVPSSQGLNAVLGEDHVLALETLHSWGNDPMVRATENLVVLISYENQVNELLRGGGSGYRFIQVALPTEQERRLFIDGLLKLAGDTRFGRPAAGMTAEELARITGGLRLRDIEGLFRLAAGGGAITRDMVREAKKKAIQEVCHDLVEVIEPEEGFERVKGLRHAVEYLNLLKWQLHQGSASVPQGIVFAGVPGCGKSYLVRALARELGYPCLAMRNVREKWVGSSERNLELVLWVAENLAPCIMWIDELDQAMGHRGEGPSADAGVSERMLARLWEFMGAMRHRGRILWVATTNRPDLLDQATLDRFGVVIPFLHPTPGEVAELLPELARQLGCSLAEDVDTRAVSSLPSLRLPTVRGLQEVVAIAAALADREAGRPGTPVGQRHLERAARHYQPNYDPLQHEFIALTALSMTTFDFLLPWNSLDGGCRSRELPPYLADMVDEEGRLDRERLEARRRELARVLRP